MSWYLWCFFFVKIYISCEKWVFSFDRSNMQIFYPEYYPSCVTSCNEFAGPRYFCQHNPLLYHLKLIPGHYWSWQRIISSLVNNFVRHTFSMSKSSIKTETVLTMTDTTEPTELLAFKRQKDGYKVTEKFPCVFLLFYHISHLLMFSVKFVYSNGRLQSRIFLSPYSWWFCFFFWTTQVCWKGSSFWGLGLLVKKYSIFVSSPQCPYMIFIHPQSLFHLNWLTYFNWSD